MDVVGAYRRTRDRTIEVAGAADPEALTRPVPACPAWSGADLVAHVVGMPVALAAGDLPSGPLDQWLDELVAARRGRSVDELADEWRAVDPALPTLLDGPAALLFADLAVHEHDLRGAVDAPDHAALEVDEILPRTVAAFAGPLRAASLGALVVESDGGTWQSHDAEAGWTLLVDPWEAVRAVNSRRSADELRALPHRGDPEPYLAVLHEHLPLPAASLHEP